MEWAMGDNAQTIQQFSLTLWYRPIQAIKFGLQYSYASARYFQERGPLNSTGGSTNSSVISATGTTGNNVNRSNFGDEHRVEFVGFFYF